jgi:spore coat polysaccharide biosynthesis predicted glycosyltransferase SpsG
MSDIVIGPGYPDAERLESMAIGAGMRAFINPRMATLMAGAKLAIAAAGSTCWELCAMRVPMILLTVAENQVPTANELARRGAARYVFGDDAVTEAIALWGNREERSRLSEVAARLVDGQGAERVYEVMAKITHNRRRGALETGAMEFE